MKRVLILAAFVFGFAQAQPTVVTSLFPYASLVQQVAGEHAEVIALIPPGVSEHTYDPTPRDMARVAGADLFVLNGGLDEWLRGLISASGSSAPILEALEVVSFAPIERDHAHDDMHDEHHDGEHHDGEHHDDEHHDDEHHDDEHHDDEHHDDEHHDDEHHDDEHHDEGDHGEHHDDEHGDAMHGDGHDHGGVNPHIWLEPNLMIQFVPFIAAALIELDPDNAEAYQANAAALQEELTQLDAELMEMLAPVRGAAFVPFHDAWPYFAAHYGLDLIVEIEPSPGREPSARYIAQALALIEGSGARAIFSERQLPPRPAEVVAENAGLPLFVLDPVGGLPDTGSYQDLLRYNAQVILEALAD